MMPLNGVSRMVSLPVGVGENEPPCQGSVTFYRGENNMARVGVPPALRPLADFLQSDVQGVVSHIDEWIERCSAVSRRELPEYRVSGNTCVVLVNHETTSITSIFSHENHYAELPTEQMIQYLMEWRNLMLSQSSKDAGAQLD